MSPVIWAMRNIAPETGRLLVEVVLGWRKQETTEVVDRTKGKVLGDFDRLLIILQS